MARDDEHLQELLDELHEALDSAESVEPALRRALRSAMEEIREVLERPDEDGARPPPTLEERVSEMALEFEVEHPTIAGTLNRLTHMLSSLGI